MSKLKDITPLDILCRTPTGNGSVAVIRREILEAIRFQENHEDITEECYFDCDRQLHPSEDVECWLRIAIKTNCQIEGLAEPLTLYRVNSEGHSAQLVKKLKSWETMLEKIRSYAPEQVIHWEKPAIMRIQVDSTILNL